MTQMANMDEQADEPVDLRAIRAAYDYAWVLGKPEGRRVLQEILLQTRYNLPLPAHDPYEMYMAEGMRRVGLGIEAAICSINPAYLETMRQDWDREPSDLDAHMQG